METQLSAEMSVQQCTAAFLDMLNHYKYCPNAMVFHVGASEFANVPAHLLHMHI